MSNWGNIEVPDKVFIERDGPYYEYSEDAPRHISVLDGEFATDNMIELFMCLPEVYTPVHLIAQGVSDAIWQLRYFSNDKVIYSDAAFNRLFSQPNPIEDIRKIIYNAVCYEILTGRQIFYLNRPKVLTAKYENILTWTNLPPNVNIKTDKTIDPYTATDIKDFIESIKIDKRVIEINNVIPIIHTSLKNNYDMNCCNSMLLGAKKAIDNLIPVYEARKAIYVKRGAMGMWVSRKGDASGSVALSSIEKKAVRNEVDSNYGLTGGRATVGVSDQPIDFINSSMSIVEMQPFTETLHDAISIGGVLGVPRSMILSPDQGTFNNVSEDKKNFITSVVMPWANRYANYFTKYFGIADANKYVFPSFDHLPALQENLKEKADVDSVNGNTWLLRWKSGVSTLNEWITSIDGVKGTLPLYDKKIFEMDESELMIAQSVMNIKNKNNENTTGTEDTSGGN